MTVIYREQISLYQTAKKNLKSLVSQTAIVSLLFIGMLLLTGGNPSSLHIGLVSSLGIGFVAWDEVKRQHSKTLRKERLNNFSLEPLDEEIFNVNSNAFQDLKDLNGTSSNPITSKLKAFVCINERDEYEENHYEDEDFSETSRNPIQSNKWITDEINPLDPLKENEELEINTLELNKQDKASLVSIIRKRETSSKKNATY